jgi:hypothetical protein
VHVAELVGERDLVAPLARHVPEQLGHDDRPLVIMPSVAPP